MVWSGSAADSGSCGGYKQWKYQDDPQKNEGSKMEPEEPQMRLKTEEKSQYER